MSEAIEDTHPVQNRPKPRSESRVSTKVTMRAYEVYVHLHGEQSAMVTGKCRGGFGVSELIAFLYAHSFPKNEWRDRTNEAFKGMNI